MQAFHNNPELKAQLIAGLQAHEAADAMMQGLYGEDYENAVGFRGCALGCTLHTLGYDSYGNHYAYEKLLEIPVELAYVQDSIFERLPIEQARTWPREFAESIPVGADLSQVWLHIGLWLLSDKTWGIRQRVEDENGELIDRLIKLYQDRIAGAAVDSQEVEALALALARARALALALARARALALALARDLARDLALDLALALALDLARALEYWTALRAEVLRLLSTAPIPVADKVS